MAETAGLVLSGIAITTLFTSCVEVLEYFENGRNWICDLGLAQAKVNLMKIRLSQLEDSLLEIADGYATDESKAGYFGPEVWDWRSGSCDSSGDDWEVSVISRGLSGIGEVLQRTSKLCRRYSYPDSSIREAAKHGHTWHTHSNPQDTAPVPQPTCRLNHINRRQSEGTSRQVQARQNRARPSGWQLLSKKMSWAVQDKKRFDTLISDFDFLLSNLEKVAGGRLELLVAASSSSSSSSISSAKGMYSPASSEKAPLTGEEDTTSSLPTMSQKKPFSMPCKVELDKFGHLNISQLSGAENPSTSMTLHGKQNHHQPSASKPNPPTPQADPSPAKPAKQKTTGKKNKAGGGSKYYVGTEAGETFLEENDLQDGSTFIVGLHKDNEAAFIASFAPPRKAVSTKNK
ncbi:hypothetical protein ACHAQA_006611 [Verticillium albo-atrum]